MTKEKIFCNVKRFAENHHASGCPCGLSTNDFQEALPPSAFMVDNASTNYGILMFNTPPTKQPEYLKFIRSHFIILAQKFHPDKNEKSLSSECTDIMMRINNAYSCVMQELCFSSQTKSSMT